MSTVIPGFSVKVSRTAHSRPSEAWMVPVERGAKFETEKSRQMTPGDKETPSNAEERDLERRKSKAQRTKEIADASPSRQDLKASNELGDFPDRPG